MKKYPHLEMETNPLHPLALDIVDKIISKFPELPRPHLLPTFSGSDDDDPDTWEIDGIDISWDIRNNNVIDLLINISSDMAISGNYRENEIDFYTDKLDINVLIEKIFDFLK